MPDAEDEVEITRPPFPTLVAQLLSKAALADAGYTTRGFARQVLKCDEKVIRNLRDGGHVRPALAQKLVRHFGLQHVSDLYGPPRP